MLQETVNGIILVIAKSISLIVLPVVAAAALDVHFFWQYHNYATTNNLATSSSISSSSNIKLVGEYDLLEVNEDFNTFTDILEDLFAYKQNSTKRDT